MNSLSSWIMSFVIIFVSFWFVFTVYFSICYKKVDLKAFIDIEMFLGLLIASVLITVLYQLVIFDMSHQLIIHWIAK